MNKEVQVAVVVGYVPTREGRAALRRAAEESLLRHSRLVVINSSRGGRAFDAEEAVRFEAEIKTIEERLDLVGVDHEVRQLVRGNEPSEDLRSRLPPTPERTRCWPCLGPRRSSRSRLPGREVPRSTGRWTLR